MLVGVASLLIPTLWNIGILLHKKAKLRKDMQHSVCIFFVRPTIYSGGAPDFSS